ncbi:MAG: sigma-70 family RNA polymerase sigma factor [Synergistaceae bacterium]|nr:sigma-70 family RNA polymerase sigma factor [Synergistaceae bacterium]
MESGKSDIRNKNHFGDIDAYREVNGAREEAKASEANEVKEEREADGTESASRRIDALVAEFAPLVRRVARRYAGRGAEREDLEQEGYVALISLAKRVTNDAYIARELSRFLPGMVRDAAGRMRWRSGVVRLNAGEDASGDDDSGGISIPDARAASDYDAAELRAAIEALPDEEERKIAFALSEGSSFGDVAELIGVGRKTLRKRIRSLWRNLARYLRNPG